MFLVNALCQRSVGQLDSTGQRPRRARPRVRPLALEVLEDRLCPSGGYLLVANQENYSVQRYDERTGAFVDTFVSEGSGGLTVPGALIFGPTDHNLYVSSGMITGPGNHQVLRYDGTTGAFGAVSADGGQLTGPRGLLFGPDGNLYVADGTVPGSVQRFDATTGAFIDEFVAPSSGGLEHPAGMVFGPDGRHDGKLDLYVASINLNSVLRYDGTTGAFKGAFVPSGSGGLTGAFGLTFGPDGNLYVASSQLFDFVHRKLYPNGSILRFEGPAGPNPGAFLGTFVPVGSGGLNSPLSLLFGPDANGDGIPDLYVSSAVIRSDFTSQGGTSQVLRYDGVTGAFIDTFVAPDSGGLRDPVFMTFTETDPTTLNYDGAGSNSRMHSTRAVAALNPASAGAAGLVGLAGIPGPVPDHAAPSLLSPRTVTNTAADLAPLSAGPSPQPVAGSHRAAAHDTPGTVLDRVFADLDLGVLLDSLQQNGTPGPTA
jgi:hypothetical protein